MSAALAAARLAAAAGLPRDDILIIIDRCGEILLPVSGSDLQQQLQPGAVVEIVKARSRRS
jgi:hypothetical protein